MCIRRAIGRRRGTGLGVLNVRLDGRGTRLGVLDVRLDGRSTGQTMFGVGCNVRGLAQNFFSFHKISRIRNCSALSRSNAVNVSDGFSAGEKDEERGEN